MGIDMSHVTNLRSFLGTAAVLFLSTGSLLAVEDKPVLVFPGGLKKDFGSVIEGKRLDHSFAFEVQGEGGLRISQARPSCGCTVSVIKVDGKPYRWNDEIPVGAKGTIEVNLKTTNIRGIKTSVIDVYSNNVEGRVQLSVSANVQQFFQLTPMYVNFGMVTGGTQPTQEIEVWSTQVDEFAISSWGEAVLPDVKQNPDGKPVDKAEIERQAEEAANKIGDQPTELVIDQERVAPNRYKLRFTLSETKKEGVFAKRLRFQTDADRTFEVTVHAVVQPLISLDPPTHYAFGLVKHGTSATGQFRLVNGDPNHEVNITGVVLENCPQEEHVRVQFYSHQEGEGDQATREWYVRVTIFETMPAGAFRGQVKIMTDHPEFSERIGYFTGVVR